MADKKDIFISTILNCGYADVDYIMELFEDFDVEYSDIDYSSNDANDVIRQIFEQALLKHADWDQNDNRGFDVSIYTNCLDSHLNIDGEEVYDKDDIIRLLANPEEAED